MGIDFLEFNIEKCKFDFTILCVNYHWSLFYIEFTNGTLEQLELFFITIYLDQKWERKGIWNKLVDKIH